MFWNHGDSYKFKFEGINEYCYSLRDNHITRAMFHHLCDVRYVKVDKIFKDVIDFSTGTSTHVDSSHTTAFQIIDTWVKHPENMDVIKYVEKHFQIELDHDDLPTNQDEIEVVLKSFVRGKCEEWMVRNGIKFSDCDAAPSQPIPTLEEAEDCKKKWLERMAKDVETAEITFDTIEEAAVLLARAPVELGGSPIRDTETGNLTLATGTPTHRHAFGGQTFEAFPSFTDEWGNTTVGDRPEDAGADGRATVGTAGEQRDNTDARVRTGVDTATPMAEREDATNEERAT